MGKYYLLSDVLEYKDKYNIRYADSHNWETKLALISAIDDYVISGYKNQLGIINIQEESFNFKNVNKMLHEIIKLGWIKRITKGKYNSVYYYSHRWYLCNCNNKGEIKSQEKEPFALGFAISYDNYKFTSYPNVKTILFFNGVTDFYEQM